MPSSKLALVTVAAALATAAACGGSGDPAGGYAQAAADSGASRRDAGASYPDDLAPKDAAADARPAGDGDGAPAQDAAARCAATTSCPADVRDLGALSGDKASPAVTATGVGSAWLKVRVTEDDGSLTSSVDLKVKLTLTSPPGENYDLVIYLASSNQVANVECTTARAQSSSASSTDQVAVSWPDNRPAGGQDDAKNVTVEVRHTSGPCAAGSAWSLRVDGNTL